MTTARLCTYCREPLPPSSGRGRPATTHPGDCRRLASNAKRLDGRTLRFLEAMTPPLGRDTPAGVFPGDAVDGSELYDDDGALSGYSIEYAPTRPPFGGKEYLALMAAHEENLADTARLNKHKSALYASDPELIAKIARIPPIPYDEYMEILRRNPEARPSPAFEYYAANREELDAAQEEYLRRLLDLEEAASAKRKRSKTPA